MPTQILLTASRSSPLSPKQLFLGIPPDSPKFASRQVGFLQGWATKPWASHRQATKGAAERSRTQKKGTRPALTRFLKNWKAEHFLAGNPFMSLFTIFHSGKFTVIDPGWHSLARLVHLVPEFPPGGREGRRSGMETPAGRRLPVTHTCYGSGDCSNLCPLSMATGFSLSIIVTKHTHRCYGTLGCSGFRGDAAAAAGTGEGLPLTHACRAPRYLVALRRVQRASRPAPGDALLDAARGRAVFNCASSTGSCS